MDKQCLYTHTHISNGFLLREKTNSCSQRWTQSNSKNYRELYTKWQTKWIIELKNRVDMCKTPHTRPTTQFESTRIPTEPLVSWYLQKCGYYVPPHKQCHLVPRTIKLNSAYVVLWSMQPNYW